MGIYTDSTRFSSLGNNNVYDYAAEIPANEAYGAALGCAQILSDCQKNDMALFESAIQNDVVEITSFYNEGVQVLNENAFTNVIKKIIEMFKKIIAKIKGIFMSFINKLRGSMKDGKKLVTKYEKQINACTDWKDFKVKAVKKPKNENIVSEIDKVFPFKLSNKFSITTKTDMTTNKIGAIGTPVEIKDMNPDEIKCKILPSYVNIAGGCDNLSDLNKKVTETLFDEEADFTVDSASAFSAQWIKGVTYNESDIIGAVKKNSDNAIKLVNAIISDLNEVDKKLASFEKDVKFNANTAIRGNNSYNYAGKSSVTDHPDYKDDSRLKDFDKSETGVVKVEDVQTYVQALQKVATNEQEVVAKVTSELLSVYKFTCAQGKKIYAAAAVYSGKHKPEKKKDEGSTEAKNESFYIDVEYVNAVAECVEDEFYMNMESL